MSAIDWLSDSLTRPDTQTGAVVGGEPPVDGGATTPDVTVTGLDQTDVPRADAIGLTSPAITGLPVGLWGQSEATTLAALISAEGPAISPTLTAFLQELLLAELDPPVGGTGQTLFLARIDKLLQMGALDPAYELLSRAGAITPEITRRWFDTALLIGHEDTVCRAMEERTDLSPTYPARIFCLARAGDWDGAVLLMGTARALDLTTDEEDALIARFLDPDLFEGEPPLSVPRPLTPLTFRMLEAVGEPVPTSGLPVAFAQADLRANIGWKARVEAGERLVRTGAVTDNQMHGLYMERKASASGGVWDRVAAVQALETALAESDEAAISAALPAIWDRLAVVETDAVIARIHGAELAALDLPAEGSDLALKLGLLSDDYETVALAASGATDETRFLLGVAKGNVAGLAPYDETARAVAEGFTSAPPDDLLRLARTDRLGEAILQALALFDNGMRGDFSDLAQAIAFFRGIGLEELARRAALDVLILERLG
ncbi:hypothetical protein [Maritimibacter sp. DP1N21-5]|uniref:hypothetical protein n=1 Tax=Maritimibacter sp. DP1N21-5 TaxID=2836867 RepID=UPI001C463000|nr:hypothetical protein [Maritimibacter sp. DP1N21-5]MBV7409775.1 hypothetical protein [Maritimibacter sp. DP1N21-5]